MRGLIVEAFSGPMIEACDDFCKRLVGDLIEVAALGIILADVGTRAFRGLRPHPPRANGPWIP